MELLWKLGKERGKTVAIVVGGIAGFGFLVTCLLFAKTLTKGKNGE